MKIDEEILTRYVNGECSPEEKKRIATWLDESIDLDDKLYTKEFQIIKADLWDKLSLKTHPAKTVHLYQRIIWYAAACLLPGIAATILFSQINRQNTIIIASEETQSLTGSKALTVQTMQQSHLRANSNVCKKQAEILFCGNFTLSDISESDWTLEISSDCHVSPYTTKKIQLKKGKEYLVMHHTFKQEEVMIIDMSKIHDLSPVMWQKVEKIFNI